MSEFYVEFFVENNEKQLIKLSSLNEKDLIEWKINMELNALIEYYKKNIEITVK